MSDRAELFICSLDVSFVDVDGLSVLDEREKFVSLGVEGGYADLARFVEKVETIVSKRLLLVTK